jgi:hypothetical protein
VDVQIDMDLSESVSMIVLTLPCETSPFPGEVTEHEYRRDVTLYYDLPLHQLRITATGNRTAIRDHLAQLLGDGVGEVIRQMYGTTTGPQRIRESVILPANTVDRIKTRI